MWFLLGDASSLTWHYEIMSMQYYAILYGCKNENFQMKNCDIFLIFAQNIDCGYEAVLTSTHNLCFRAKIRKLCIPMLTPILLYKSGVLGGINHTGMLS